MKKGFGWFLAAAALLTPYAAEKNEETGEYEIRSLLLRVKTKTVTDDDGTEHRDCTDALRQENAISILIKLHFSRLRPSFSAL